MWKDGKGIGVKEEREEKLRKGLRKGRKKVGD
jgi:hypothetical protein